MRLGTEPLPAVAERMKRLEEQEVIRAYNADLDLSRLGRKLHVYVRTEDQSKDYARFKKVIETMDEILECYHVSGEGSFLLRAAATACSPKPTAPQRLNH